MTFLLLSEMKKWDFYVDPINRLESAIPKPQPSSPASWHKHGLSLTPVPTGPQEVGPRRQRREGRVFRERELASWGRSPQARSRTSRGSQGTHVLTRAGQPAITASCVSIMTSATHDAKRPVSQVSVPLLSEIPPGPSSAAKQEPSATRHHIMVSTSRCPSSLPASG